MLAPRSNDSQNAHVLQFLHLQVIPGDCCCKVFLTGNRRKHCLNPSVCRQMLNASWPSRGTLLLY